MSEQMCIRGYGLRLLDIQQYFDVEKFVDRVRTLHDVQLVDTVKADEDIDGFMNRVDEGLTDDGKHGGVEAVIEMADVTNMTEFIANNRGEWFVMLPSCMSWEFGDHAPQTIEQAEQLLMRVLRLFVLDNTPDAALHACFHHLDDIS